MVRVISETVRLPEPESNEKSGKRRGRLIGRSTIIFCCLLLVVGAVLYVVLDGRLLAQILPAPAAPVVVPAAVVTLPVPAVTETSVDPVLERIDARVDEALSRIDQIDQNVRTSLQTSKDALAGVPQTDRAPAPGARPWVLHGDGLKAIDSRDPEVNKTTEIHVSTELSDDQVKTLAAEVGTQFDPKLDTLLARVDSRLGQEFQEMAARHKLTDAQLVSLKTELTHSVGVVLQEEMTRNEELSENNATYRVLFQRSLDLNQDLIGLYATQCEGDHAIGNVLKVVPKLFTLQVWQNRDSSAEYLRLLTRYEELTITGKELAGEGE